MIKTKGSFAQNFAFTFSASAVNVVAQIFLAPIIARIYGPEAYGTYAIFNALIMNLSMISTLLYINAFVLPKEKEEFSLLFKITLLSSSIFSFLVFIVTIFFGKDLLVLLNSEPLGLWVYLIGPAVLLQALTDITKNTLIRQKAFKENITIGIPIAIGTKLFNIFFGLLTGGLSAGLILGDLLAKALAVGLRVRNLLIKTFREALRTSSPYELKKVALKYKNFPLYVLPGNWVNLFSGQIPIYILTISYGSNTVGQFALATSLLEIPMRLLGNAISPVFLQKAAEINIEDQSRLKVIVKELYDKLFLLGVVPFTILTIFGDKIFAFVLGEKWEVAGLFAGFLGYYYVFRLISSPLSSVFTILNKEKQLFLFQILIFILRLLGLYIGVYVFKSEYWAVLLYSLGNTVSYFLLLIINFLIVDIPPFYTILKTIIIILVSFIFFYLMRYLLFSDYLFFDNL